MEAFNKFKKVGKLHNSKGTVIAPEAGGLKMVLSFSNLTGKSEGPIFDLLNKKWHQVAKENRMWFINKTGTYKLGAMINTAVQSDVWVLHLLCQDEKLSVDKDALKTCVKKSVDLAKSNKASFHISQLLLDAAPDLKSMIDDMILSEGFDTYIYPN